MDAPRETPNMDKAITLRDLSKHNSKEDCWIAVHSKVWDITGFVDSHPGGAAGMSRAPLSRLPPREHEKLTGTVLLQCAGSNATALFNQVHAPDMLDELPYESFKGYLQEASADTPASPPAKNTPLAPTDSQATVDVPVQHVASDSIPPLEAILSAPDFERAAEKALTPKAWAFYSSAATDLVTHTNNKKLLRRIMIRPRVLRDVRDVSLDRTVLGFHCKAPFFISPTAMARLAHPDGELALSRAAANEGIIQTVRWSPDKARRLFSPLCFLLRSNALPP